MPKNLPPVDRKQVDDWQHISVPVAKIIADLAKRVKK